jgi:hypothetical protein
MLASFLKAFIMECPGKSPKTGPVPKEGSEPWFGHMTLQHLSSCRAATEAGPQICREHKCFPVPKLYTEHQLPVTSIPLKQALLMCSRKNGDFALEARIAQNTRQVQRTWQLTKGRDKYQFRGPSILFQKSSYIW